MRSFPLIPRTAEDLRPEVLEFALEMERKLRVNDHKGGWQSCTMHYLSCRLSQEREELKRAVRRSDSRGEVLAEAADVANFAMMIADVYKASEKGGAK